MILLIFQTKAMHKSQTYLVKSTSLCSHAISQLSCDVCAETTENLGFTVVHAKWFDTCLLFRYTKDVNNIDNVNSMRVIRSFISSHVSFYPAAWIHNICKSIIFHSNDVGLGFVNETLP